MNSSANIVKSNVTSLFLQVTIAMTTQKAWVEMAISLKDKLNPRFWLLKSRIELCVWSATTFRLVSQTQVFNFFYFSKNTNFNQMTLIIPTIQSHQAIAHISALNNWTNLHMLFASPSVKIDKGLNKQNV